jgi:hypothetical protein
MRQSSSIKFERRFFNLAKWMLACNLAAMGGVPTGRNVPKGKMEFHLLGLHDFSVSMWMLCQKQRGRRVILKPGVGWFAVSNTLDE